ncbi:MAG TPA: hypothetical protein RMG48_12555 [Myxococcales bacterium LLY-WYZ-16_1]|nr:hypothetical protein [Myxococcales bacterium LLY-WYZ-16_1]
MNDDPLKERSFFWMRVAGLLVATGAFACGSGESRELGAVKAGQCTIAASAGAPARTVPTQVNVPTDSVNVCLGQQTSDSGECDLARCTMVGTTRTLRSCRSDGDCESSQLCIFDAGCEAPQGFCSRSLLCLENRSGPASGPIQPRGGVFCGCDGTTYLGGCADRPVRHGGPCEGFEPS